ncbi:UDP-N-acetylmuramate--L-alanine ligase [Candidatus Magnetominusculus xianensis]|uniref:UDP-N-acetylmuramate--L-alanine ligase n=1 Tax=Candidatus Magnetominusculus xianensis TaxID=1748249 RepID=A0ABR5SHS2_9BACT|nr:UDP-N-acetylmuramate--L-alanine ligase [Candidatus Magnetominusculus xianensis]KWT89809.1 UDP-N-acetylmuramate--L-alanine ligase [Candidatus Magnetominusculus xianensis]MBF0404596.1 UDP-N-acetylmuramate--L-alanine ligase [Nitrospirota bacterium]
MFNRYRVIHFVGIGGIGMSGIAQVLNDLGYEVKGSDIKDSSMVEKLRNSGITVMIGHKAENIGNAHVVVITSAVSTGNPEVEEAKRRAIPVIPRAEMLAELGRLKYTVLVAGSHGKTTTSSLIATILMGAGAFDPTVVLGGKLNESNSNSRVGRGDYLVAEADESDGSFLKLNPTVAVCTNIDREHMDYFSTMERLKGAFVDFLNKVPFYGVGIVCTDDPNIREILPRVNRRYVTYGLDSGAQYTAKNIDYGFMRTSFDLYKEGQFIKRFEIRLAGTHNVLNSLAAIAAAESLGVEVDSTAASLGEFSGIKRRMEFKGAFDGIKVYDDYGHHPTEIEATIGGIKDHVSNRLIVAFQPHRYTRTRDLMDNFAASFSGVSKLYLLDIYSAGEPPIDGISSEVLAAKVRKNGVDVVYCEAQEAARTKIGQALQDGDVLVTFGAGDIWKLGEELVKQRGAG